MSPMLLNGEKFQSAALRPFGLELQPGREGGIDLQAWVNEDADRIIALVREYALVVVRNARRTGYQPWNEVEPAKLNGSTNYPHFDDGGQTPVLMWVLDGHKRNPTAFVPAQAVAEAAIAQRGVLEGVGTDDSAIAVRVRGLVENLHKQAVEFDFCACHRLLQWIGVEEAMSRKMGGVPGVEPSREPWMPAWVRYLAGADVRGECRRNIAALRKSVEAWQECTSALQRFRACVVGAVQTRSHPHRWSEKPDAGVLVDNTLRFGNGGFGGTCHFSSIESSIDGEAPLLRAKLLANGCIVEKIRHF